MRQTKIITDNDGVVIYDPSDDMDDSAIIQEADGTYRLLENEEIFTDEYMQEFDRRQEAKQAKMRRDDRIISVCVIASIIAFTALLVWIFF